MQTKRTVDNSNAEKYQSWQAPVVEGSIVSSDGFAGPPTVQDLEEIQKQAYEEAKQEGYKTGHEQGYAEGKQESIAEWNARIELLDGYLTLLNEPLSRLNDNIEQELVNLSLLIARQIIRRELKQDPGEIVAVVREAINAIPNASENTRIYLHPEDAELIRGALSLKDEDLNWQIEEDLLLQRGDCRIETNSSLIDASVESRLSAIAASMLGGERQSDE